MKSETFDETQNKNLEDFQQKMTLFHKKNQTRFQSHCTRK